MKNRTLFISSICVLCVLLFAGCGAVTSQFPLPDEVKNFTSDMDGDQINFQTNQSSVVLLDFYRQQLTNQGLTERELLTVQEGGTISIVFDGNEKGAIVVQAVDLPTGDTNVNIRFEDI